MDISIGQYVISMSAYIVLLLLMIEFMRKNLKIATVFWFLTLLTFPLWPNQLDGWFRWAKTLSVLLPTAIFVGLGRWSNLKQSTNWLRHFKKDWLLWVLYGVLFLNIAEATAKDLVSGNYFNGISGIILCATIPFLKMHGSAKKHWTFSKDKKVDLLVYTSPAWNFLYTTWNLAFVFGENAGFFASSFCILLAAELYPLIKRRPELYITARIFTLATHILIRATYDVFTPLMDSTSWANESVVYYWGLVNLVLHVPFLIWYASKYYTPLCKKEVLIHS